MHSDEQVVAEIEADAFGITYKGSSLETVVGSTAEQRQIFKGRPCVPEEPKLPTDGQQGQAPAWAAARPSAVLSRSRQAGSR